MDEAPDIGAAIRDYLKDSTVLIDANHVGSANNIYVGLPKNKDNVLSVPTFSNLVAIFTGRGGLGEVGLAQFMERVDISCYGSNEAQCKKIARAIMQYIHPQDGRRKTSFTRKTCRVTDMRLEGGPTTLFDPDAAQWPYTTITYMTRYCLVPVS